MAHGPKIELHEATGLGTNCSYLSCGGRDFLPGSRDRFAVPQDSLVGLQTTLDGQAVCLMRGNLSSLYLPGMKTAFPSKNHN